ncbi:AMP-binding protein [Pontitalea aquivivens]|uniref:AMP-binding protein n=1 Tax=Pontitalea aquivivens TaxID=3388663 RepID=UPI0039707B77
MNRFDPAGHARAMREGGFWVDRYFDDILIQTIAATPDKAAIVADRDRGQTRISYAELGDLVARAAAGLSKLGLGKGDVVAIQSPNWWEFVVATLACQRIGAVLNPLMPIFREHELEFMLGFAEARAFIVPKIFAKFDFESMANSLKAKLPKLDHVIVMGGEGNDAFEKVLLGHEDRLMPDPALRAGPDDLAFLMYTSGTTGSPKGAMHTINTVMTCTNNIAERAGLTKDDVIHVASPVGHMLGFAASVKLALRLGATMTMQDVWEGKRGVELMAAEGVTYTGGATPFLLDVVETVKNGGANPEKLRVFLCAGAPIPPALIERARNELDLTVCSVWGMTETLASTMTEPERAAEKSSRTDGRPTPGVAVCVVDDDNQPLPTGTVGRLMVRGSQSTLGYFKRPDLEIFDADGWMDTGDLAYMDDEGYIRIAGRTKDVIIRGGENVPVADVENVLYEHPAVLAVALVGYPDERLGERGCAFVQLRPGQSLDLAAVQAHMDSKKVAKQYWPERIEILDAMPRTPTGKIQKFVLREQAKAFGATA